MRILGKALGTKVLVAARRCGAVVLGLPEGVVSVLRETVTKDSGAVKSLKALWPVSRRHVSSAALSLVVMLVAMAVAMVGVAVAAAPVKEILTSQFGWDVNKTKTEQPGASQQERDVCMVASGDECQAGEASTVPGGFGRFSPTSVAVAPDGDLYIADQGNKRVQVLTSTGGFVLMFGWDVHKTTKANVCLAGETCKAGVEGTAPGQFTFPQSIAVDPTNEDFYVAEVIVAGGTG